MTFNIFVPRAEISGGRQADNHEFPWYQTFQSLNHFHQFIASRRQGRQPLFRSLSIIDHKIYQFTSPYYKPLYNTILYTIIHHKRICQNQLHSLHWTEDNQSGKAFKEDETRKRRISTVVQVSSVVKLRSFFLGRFLRFTTDKTWKTVLQQYHCSSGQ